MNNLQPIFRLCLFIFFILGMVQTIFGQTIDSMSKVILDNMEKQYASYETMRYVIVVDYYYEIDTMTISVKGNQMKIVINKYGSNIVTIINGQEQTTFVKSQGYEETHSFSNFMYVFWLGKQLLMFSDNTVIEIDSYKTSKNEAQDIFDIEILNKYKEETHLFLDTSTYHILELHYLDNMSLKFINFEANPTFPDDYFEIKE